MFSDIHNAYPIRYCEMAERVRRTNAEIDHAVMTELEKLVTRKGFGNVLVTELMANARLDPLSFIGAMDLSTIFMTSWLRDTTSGSIIRSIRQS